MSYSTPSPTGDENGGAIVYHRTGWESDSTYWSLWCNWDSINSLYNGKIEGHMLLIVSWMVDNAGNAMFSAIGLRVCTRCNDQIIGVGQTSYGAVCG